MDNKIKQYLELEKLFTSHGYHLYLVGGTVRDFLLKRDFKDMDLVTDCLPEVVVSILKNYKVDSHFIKYGSLKVIYNGIKFDITTLREEKDYIDSRHPSEVIFTTSLEADHKRRDFTINAMYMDKDFNVIDYESGTTDLSKKLIQTVGEPNKRLQEDPLRILRAIRFSYTLGFFISDKLKQAIIDNAYLLKNLNQNKIEQEISKFNCQNKETLEEIFSSFGIEYLLSMIK